jgi:hypothetical protein
MDAGHELKYDEDDRFDKTLPADLVERLTKDDLQSSEGEPEIQAVVEPPVPDEPPMIEWLSQARDRATSSLIEAVLASPLTVVTAAKVSRVTVVDKSVEIAKAETASLRAEVGRLRAAIGGSAALPAGEVPAFVVTQESTMVPWTSDFAAIAAKQENK